MAIALLSAGEWLGLAGGLLGLVLLAGQGWVLVHVLTQNGRLLIRLEELEARTGIPGETRFSTQSLAGVGLPIGATAPNFRLPGLHNETLTLDTFRVKGAPVLLIFSNPGCGPCAALLPEIAHWQRKHAGRITIAVLSYGDRDASRATAAEHGLVSVLLPKDRVMAEAYGSDGTPDAVLVHPDGTIGSQLAMGTDAIRELVASLTSNGDPMARSARIPMEATG